MIRPVKKVMNYEFDDLTKALAHSVTRRCALKKFGVGFAGVVLASCGLANRAHAVKACASDVDCPKYHYCGYVGSARICIHIKGSPY